MSIDKKSAEWWIEKYPFLMVKDNSVYPWIDIGSTEEHWLSDLPDGWVNSFGIQMCDELLDALGEYVDDFIIVQTKEKYGSLVIYYYWHRDNHTEKELEEIQKIDNVVHDILNKYIDLSYHTCVRCGQPATKYTSPWILPCCSECFEDLM